MDLDDEVDRLFSHVPDADQKRIKDNYKQMRTDQMQHRECSLNKDDRLELAGWMLFPEMDDECQEGRDMVGELLASVLARNGKPINPKNEKEAKELEEENHLKAKIASLLKNDHDYEHNDDEIHRDHKNARKGDHPLAGDKHHLPEKFIVFNKQARADEKFNPRKLYEEHMFAIFQGTYKTPLDPKERAVVGFYNQVLDQVLPGSLLDDDAQSKNARQAIIDQYTEVYRRSDPELSARTVGERQWRNYQQQALSQFPTLVQAMRVGQLTSLDQLWDTKLLADAELLKEDLERSEAIYFKVEQQERAYVLSGPGLPTVGLRRDTELRLPDHAHMMAYAEFHNPTMPYREARRQYERNLIAGSNSIAKQIIKPQIDDLEKKSLADWHAYGKISSQQKYASAHLRNKFPDDMTARAQQVALSEDPFWYCNHHDDARQVKIRRSLDSKEFYKEQTNQPGDTEADHQERQKLRQARLDLRNPSSAVWKDANCSHKISPRSDPFKSYNPNPKKPNEDPIFRLQMENLPHPK